MPASPASNAALPRRRIAIYLFYDDAGIVDPYVTVALRAFREHVDRLVVVSNGRPGPAGLEALRECADDVLIRDNVGFDVWAYKEAVERLGREAARGYDELILLNYTFYAPIFPLEEMFDAMDARECDFWGITAHRECRPNPLTGGEVLPFHIQSHFIAVRQPMLDSDAFWSYWAQMPMIRSYLDSIEHHEARFTRHFSAQGFRCALYMDPDSFETVHPLFLEIDRMMERRCPILKRRPFFHDPIYLEGEAIDLRRALDRVARHSSYDIDLITRNALRTTDLRTLYTNLELLDVLPEARARADAPPWTFGRVGVLAHVYYVDMLDEMLEYVGHIPGELDLFVTTDSDAKKREIGQRLAAFDRGEIRVDVVETNLGRDMAALLIAQRDVVLSGRYGLLCRIHSKKSLQDGASRAGSFRHHLFDNLLGSEGYVANLFDLFEREPHVGIAIPPTVHIGYPTLGHAWFLNRPRVEALARQLDIRVSFDTHTPIATYGSMFWFRPQALRRLFEYPWRWQQFDEAVYGDSDLPHAIERLIAYCAQAEGYGTRCVFTARQAAKNYTKLEYKLQLLSSCFRSGDIRAQVLQMMYGTERTTEANVSDWSSPPRVRVALTGLAFALKRSAAHRWRHFVERWRSERQIGRALARRSET